MPEQIVDALESVEINEERGNGYMRTHRTGHHEFCALEDQCTIGEPSQRVVKRLMLHLPEKARIPNRGCRLAGEASESLAQLVVVFVDDAPAAFRELARVTKPGGVVATTMWEVEGMDMMVALNEVRKELRPDAFARTAEYRDEQSLRELFEQCGLSDVETTTLEVAVDYESVDELWEPAIHVGGPGGPMAEALGPEELARGREIFEEALGRPTGTFRLAGRSATVRGTRG